MTLSNSLPRLRGRAGEGAAESAGENGREVVLLADTFNRYFERENLDAAVTVLQAAGYTVHIAKPADGSRRPLCCGRTFLSIGRVDQAKREAERVIAAVAPYVARGVPVVGLEPSCILGFRDEVPAMIKSEGATQLSMHALMFEEFLVRERAAGRLDLPLKPIARRALIHGHCHQKAFGMFSAVQRILKLIPDLEVETVESSCCGMAGAFGYGCRHHRCLDGDGRTLAAACRAQGRYRNAHCGGRNLVPPPDPRRCVTRGASRRPRAGDECPGGERGGVRRRRGLSDLEYPLPQGERVFERVARLHPVAVNHLPAHDGHQRPGVADRVRRDGQDIL